MDQKKKLLVIGLIIFSIVLGGASIFIAQQLQSTQAPSDSNASGFGEAVNKQYFEAFARTFTNRGCFALISDSTVAAYTPLSFPEVKKYSYTITNQDPQDKNPVNCTINLGNNKSIELSVFTYNQDSGIDPSAEALFSRINTNIITVVNKVTAPNMDFFFGIDSNDSTSCRVNFFNSRNDFEYITLKYKGFDKQCSELTDLNDEMMYVLDQSVNNLITSVIQDNK